MKRKDVEKALHKAVQALAIKDGFTPLKDYVCAKEVADGVWWRLDSYLTDRQSPYFVNEYMSCEYLHASKAIENFLQANNLKVQAETSIGIYSSIGKYARRDSILRVSENNVEESAFELYDRFKEGSEIFLSPRVDQKFIVEEYLTKLPQKWPGGDLLQCCFTILSYGLLKNDVSLVKKSVERVFEILERPKFNQMHRDFFESLRTVVEKL